MQMPKSSATPRPAPHQQAGGPRRNPWIVFSLLAITQFVVVLDTSIVYVALPSIDRQMGFSPTGLPWVMDAYILAFGGFMLLGGPAADLFGRRRVLYGGLLVFAVASLACGLSQETWQLVTARAAQGLGAALVSPAALALVAESFDEGPDRYKALGIFGGIGGAAGAIGVVLGGALTTIGWQWAFLVNVPLVIAIALAGIRLIPAARPRTTGGLDVVGAITGTAGLCLLLYAILSGGASGWTSAAVLTQAAVAVALLALFVVRQAKAAAPLIPRSLFRLRNIVLGNVANTIVGALLFGVFFVVTLYLQQARGYDPLTAAFCMMPISVFLFAGSQTTARLIGKVGAPTALAIGAAVQAGALAWWAGVLSPERDIVTSFILPGVAWGFGCGITIVGGFVVCTSGLHGPVMGAASGLVSTTLQIGGAMGVAVLGLVAHPRTTGAADAAALASGHTTAFGTAAIMAVAAAAVMVWLRRVQAVANAAADHSHGVNS